MSRTQRPGGDGGFTFPICGRCEPPLAPRRRTCVATSPCAAAAPRPPRRRPPAWSHLGPAAPRRARCAARSRRARAAIAAAGRQVPQLLRRRARRGDVVARPRLLGSFSLRPVFGYRFALAPRRLGGRRFGFNSRGEPLGRRFGILLGLLSGHVGLLVGGEAARRARRIESRRPLPRRPARGARGLAARRDARAGGRGVRAARPDQTPAPFSSASRGSSAPSASSSSSGSIPSGCSAVSSSSSASTAPSAR